MLLFEFFDRFDRLPYIDRDRYIDKKFLGVLTPAEINRRLMRIQRELEPLETERDDLLKVAEEYFASRPKPKIDLRD